MLGGYALGVVYIMDHEVIPCSPKICDWLLNSSRDHLVDIKGKMVRPWLEVSKRPSFKPTLSIVMVQRVLW